MQDCHSLGSHLDTQGYKDILEFIFVVRSNNSTTYVFCMHRVDFHIPKSNLPLHNGWDTADKQHYNRSIIRKFRRGCLIKGVYFQSVWSIPYGMLWILVGWKNRIFSFLCLTYRFLLLISQKIIFKFQSLILYLQACVIKLTRCIKKTSPS